MDTQGSNTCEVLYKAVASLGVPALELDPCTFADVINDGRENTRMIKKSRRSLRAVQNPHVAIVVDLFDSHAAAYYVYVTHFHLSSYTITLFNVAPSLVEPLLRPTVVTTLPSTRSFAPTCFHGARSTLDLRVHERMECNNSIKVFYDDDLYAIYHA